MKHVVVLAAAILLAVGSRGQTNNLSIEDCYQLARKNYPMLKQHDLIAKTKQYSIQNAGKGYLPQLNVYGQLTHQSDVTTVPIKIIGVEIPILNKTQYRIYAELDQTIYDGGNIKNEQRGYAADALVDSQRLEVDLYALKGRVNDLFFGSLLMDEEISQNELRKKDIELGLKKIEASIANGTALKSSADQLKAELLQADQQSISLKSTRKAYMDMLAVFINQPTDNATLVKPPLVSVSQEIKRPELLMYDYQRQGLDVQTKKINSATLPRFDLFVQGGAGLPGLDLLKNEFAPFYMGGVRLNWSLTGLYTQKKQRALVDFNRRNIDLQRETFIFNTNLDLKNQNAGINKLEQLLKEDDEIIDLRARVKNSSLAQLENGVITTNDYLTQVNAEDQARQNKILNQIQLLITVYQQKTTTGN